MLKRKKPAGPSSGVLMKAAMDYGRLGWSVVPIDPLRKRPVIPWEVYRHRHPETKEIGDWFTTWPNANLAVVTGVVSDLLVLDLNPARGGERARIRLEQQHGPLPETVEARSGSGGVHLYFRHPGGVLQGRIAVAPGIDLHGDGDFVVAPPSLHASGKSYRWVRSPDVFYLEPLPAWLLSPGIGAERPSDLIGRLQNLSHTGVGIGGRGKAIDSLARHLLGQGVDPKVALELLLCWNAIRCQPPLAPDRVIRNIESMGDRTGNPADGSS